jgi:hypothetical protein
MWSYLVYHNVTSNTIEFGDRFKARGESPGRRQARGEVGTEEYEDLAG